MNQEFLILGLAEKHRFSDICVLIHEVVAWISCILHYGSVALLYSMEITQEIFEYLHLSRITVVAVRPIEILWLVSTGVVVMTIMHVMHPTDCRWHFLS